jgi:hypothetical protein
VLRQFAAAGTSIGPEVIAKILAHLKKAASDQAQCGLPFVTRSMPATPGARQDESSRGDSLILE